MTRDCLQRLLQLFEQCVELDPAERDGLIDSLEGDDQALRPELEEMLRADEVADAQLGRIVEASAAKTSPIRLPVPGERVASYELLEIIGEGGMGVVFRARQLEPSREVAVKVIRPGIDTEEVLRRFALERRVLGRLDHPGISRIYDSGATAEGLPYFVMEYLDSEPLDQFCDDRTLSTVDRLVLFLDICDVVEHAHARGVLHRDIKPSNILVIQRDGRSVPVLIDFGVAKVLDPSGNNPGFTRTGRTPGTPAYMSPEQLAGAPDSIDTRTDVYSLGAVLFELLVGAVPSDTSRPSTVLSTLVGGGEEVARRQATSVGALLRNLRGDLDWIVVRALERDPVLRYSSVSELATDLRRYLSSLPVHARPSDWRYRLRKLHRRHRSATTAAAVSLFLLLGGLVATVGFSARATAAEQLAVDRLVEVERLSDRLTLRDALEASDTLTPAYPDKIPALERWLDSALELGGRLPLHKAVLDSLRATAISETGRPAPPDTLRARLESWEATFEAALATPALVDGRNHRGAPGSSGSKRLRVWGPGVASAGTSNVDVPNVETQWVHDETQDLVERLQAFVDPDPNDGTLAWMARHLAKARRLAELEGTPQYNEAWRVAQLEIEESSLYRGLDLPIQSGLVPLGLNPSTDLQEFWHVLSGPKPVPTKGPGPSRWEVADSMGVVLVLVPPGRVSAPTSHPYNPLTTEWVDVPAFFVSKYEFTIGQWIDATGEDRLARRTAQEVAQTTRRRAPVSQVSADEALQVFPTLGLRVPNEAEWLYASRGGVPGDLPWLTAGQFTDHANLADRRLPEITQWSSAPFVRGADDGFGGSAPVGSFLPNGFGLHDVIGNVNEILLTGDVDQAGRLPLRRVIDRQSSTTPLDQGGSHRTLPRDANFANRTVWLWGARDELVGLRPVRSVENP